MILRAAGKILQPEAVFNRDDDPAVLFPVREDFVQLILKGQGGMQVALRILKNADEENIIVVGIQVRLDVLEIADEDIDIFTVLVPVGVDKASLFGEVDAGDAFARPCERTGNRAGARSDFQDLLGSVEGNPADDVFPDAGEMVERGPVLLLPDDPVEL